MLNFTGTYTDQYQLTMAEVYFLKDKKNDQAVFDYFFRKLPFNGGYAVFAGLNDLLTVLENLRFDEKDIDFLAQQHFHPEFLDELKKFRFKGKIYACREGDLVFPFCPVLRVEGRIIEAQLVETLLLNLLNFQTLIATKAARMRQSAGEAQLIDFGLRRAQGTGGYFASRAAIIGGFNASSHVRAGRDYAIPLAGTMAHSFIQSFDDELSAFRQFAEVWPERCVLLVDTYNTLEAGIPHAITVAKEMEASGKRLSAIRLDSGDLAYLAKKARKMLNDAGLDYVEIAVSNQLDEYVIKSLLEQEAPIDIFGVGTNLAVGAPDGALDGVYKLSLINDKPKIKLSESLSKITLPYRKQIYRILDEKSMFLGADVITLDEEEPPERMYHPLDSAKQLAIGKYKKEPLLHLVMADGKPLCKLQPLNEIASYSQMRLNQLPSEYKRFSNPHIYKTGISARLKEARLQLKEKYQKK